jgi:UrcA family protein
MKRSVFLALIATVAFAIAAPAQAVPLGADGLAIVAPTSRDDGFHFATLVSFEDLNIDHLAGADVLLHRIKNAAVLGCGGDRNSRQLLERALQRACVSDAVGRAVTELNIRAVTARYNDADSTAQLALVLAYQR